MEKEKISQVLSFAEDWKDVAPKGVVFYNDTSKSVNFKRGHIWASADARFLAVVETAPPFWESAEKILTVIPVDRVVRIEIPVQGREEEEV